jgi:meiosis induction protein kinase IME2/SME1
MSQNQQNGHSQQHLSQQQRQQNQQQRCPVTVVGIPSVSIENNRLVVGDASTSLSIRFSFLFDVAHPNL